MNSFNYIQAKSLKEASVYLKKQGNRAIPYAGGTDVLGMLKGKLISPSEVVNLKNIEGLKGIKYDPVEGLVIGAMTTIAEIAESKIIYEKYTALYQAAKETASPQLRNMGTVGGNLCQRPRCWYYREDFNCLRKGGDTCYAFDGKNKYHCIIGGSPCYIVHPSDLAVALMAFDADLVIYVNGKTKTVPVSSFFVLPDTDFMNENILKPGEIITEIHIRPQDPKTVSSYIKFRERDVWDFAIVSVAAAIKKNGNAVDSASVVFGGVAPVPWMEQSFNVSLKGLTRDEVKINNLVKNLLNKSDPLEMNAYKVPLARNLTRKLLMQIM